MFRLKQSDTFLKWQRKLKDRKAKALIAMRLHRLSQGHAGDAAPVAENIYELRIHYGPGYRMYYQQRGETIVLLLNGGDKSTQKRDIKAARKIASEWKESDG